MAILGGHKNMNGFALGIVADSPQAASLRAAEDYERKARRRACEPERPNKNYNFLYSGFYFLPST